VWIGLATLISLWVIKRWFGGFIFPAANPILPINSFL
jgi:hypothetical protein